MRVHRPVSAGESGVPYPRIKPDPDFGRLLAVFRRATPDRVPLIEFYMDFAVIGEAASSADPVGRWREIAEMWRRLGYDGFPVAARFDLPRSYLHARDTASSSTGTRTWRDEGRGPIASWEDLEKYPWPAIEQIDFSDLEHAAKALPEGMRLIGADPGGVLEAVEDLMGVEPLAYGLADQPDLVQAVFDRCGQVMLDVCRTNASHEAVGAVILGDDMGFKTQTILSPDALRRYLFPWHRRIAEAVHAYGKPLLLHSCGQVEAVMEDLIDDVGIDAKHSFEDVIMPVEEAKRRWGSRVAILGGIDMDLLARGTPDQVRQRTRQVLEACMPGGGYALGSGNSIANYLRMENYFAMIEEGWEVGVYS
jgi:uroporphyrinogen decarboxylase